jgi:predicted esterase
MKIAGRWWKFLLLAVIVIFLGIWGYQLIAVRGTFAPSRPVSTAGGDALLLGAPGHRIAGRVYLTGAPNPAAPLVIVLHGDAPYVNPRYQYLFASDVANAAPGTRVAALMRPGYSDAYGERSDGDRGFASGENYTPEVLDDVAAAIQELRSQWGAPAVFLLGHSGGAAVTADIAALHPGLVQHAFLISCPCDVPAFRLHMARLEWGPLWLLPAHSLSPMQTLDQMQPGTEITAISGADDPIALPQYAEAYVAKAKDRGISASMIHIPGKGHEILNEPEVVSEVAKAASKH